MWRAIGTHRRAIAAAAAGLALAAALGAPRPAGAETLTDAWRMALHRNGEIAASRNQRSAADAERTAAERGRWPTLAVEGGYTQLNQSPILDIQTSSGPFRSPKIWKHDGYVSAAADLSVPLWTSGALGGSIGAARAGARGAAAAESMTKADVKFAVTQAYVGVLRARSELQVADTSLSSLKAHAHDVQVMYDKQAVAKTDQLAAQVALANALQARLRAANALAIATAAYNRWVGEPLDRTPDLVEPPPAAAPVESIGALVARALETRPEVAVLEAQHTRLEDAARAERAQSLPQVALHAGYTHFDNQILDRQNIATIGVQFRWRLFDAGQIREHTAALRSRAWAVQRQLEDLRSKIALQVRTSALDRDDAAARLRAAGLAVAQARENQRVADELYRSGLGTNTQVLEAESLRATALKNRDDARYDLVIAGYRLDLAIGAL